MLRASLEMVEARRWNVTTGGRSYAIRPNCRRHLEQPASGTVRALALRYCQMDRQSRSCLAHPGLQSQSERVTEVVVKYLRKRGVPDKTIAEALPQSQYQFKYPMNIAAQLVVFMPPDPRLFANMVSQHQMNARGPESLEDVMREVRLLDGKYEYARLNGNAAEALKLVEALIEIIKARLRMGEDKKQMDEVREEILRNSRNIAPIIRRLERQEPAPTPSGGRVQIRPRVVGPFPGRVEYIRELVLEDFGEAEGEKDAE
jgi:hypothetical protein